MAARALFFGRGIRGIVAGEVVPELFIPRLIDLYREGRFPFDRLLQFYPLADINEAAAAAAEGRVLKPVLLME